MAPSATDVLAAAGHAPRGVAARATSALVVGAGGALGSAVLEQLLGSARFAPLRMLVTRDFRGSVQGLEPVVAPAPADPAAWLADAPASAEAASPLADLAVIVFDRERRANGREDALVRAGPAALVPLATWLRERRVRDLIVVVPHSPLGLPQALRRGLASLDEQAVAALGFERTVFLRMARAGGAAPARAWLQRVADALLQQLWLLMPASHKPVRTAQVARFVGALAARLPASPPGTRVVAPEFVWQAAQAGDRDDAAGRLIEAWLAGRELPDLQAPKMRL